MSYREIKESLDINKHAGQKYNFDFGIIWIIFELHLNEMVLMFSD